MSAKNKIFISGKTDVGKYRNHNEDAFIVCRNIKKKEWFFDENPVNEIETLLVVADGMGGADAGDIASKLLTQSIKKSFQNIEKEYTNYSKEEIDGFLKKVILEGNKEIIEYQNKEDDIQEMGTTVVIACVLNSMLYLSWVGDSRCYLFRNGKLKQLTNDHAPVWDLVLKGELTSEEARLHPNSNYISQYVGQIDELPVPECTHISLYENDRILLCSDGLSGMLSDDVIEKIIAQRNTPWEACNELINEANLAGGDDNITTVIWGYYETEEAFSFSAIEHFQKNIIGVIVFGAIVTVLITLGIVIQDFYQSYNQKKIKMETADENENGVVTDLSLSKVLPSIDSTNLIFSEKNQIETKVENDTVLSKEAKKEFERKVNTFVGQKESLKKLIATRLCDSTISIQKKEAFQRLKNKRDKELNLYLPKITTFEGVYFKDFTTDDKSLIEKTLDGAFQNYKVLLQQFEELDRDTIQ